MRTLLHTGFVFDNVVRLLKVNLINIISLIYIRKILTFLNKLKFQKIFLWIFSLFFLMMKRRIKMKIIKILIYLKIYVRNVKKVLKEMKRNYKWMI